jgi:hypothetical protein
LPYFGLVAFPASGISLAAFVALRLLALSNRWPYMSLVTEIVV